MPNVSKFDLNLNCLGFFPGKLGGFKNWLTTKISFIFFLVGSTLAGMTSFSFLEGLNVAQNYYSGQPGGRVMLEIWRIRLTQPAGARLSLAI